MSRRPVYLGLTKDKPLTLGHPDGSPARLTVATGLVMGIRINEERWVTGEAVDHALLEGSLVEIQTERQAAGANLATQDCDRCGHPITEHAAFHDAPLPEQLVGRQTASFGGVEFQGVYCPTMTPAGTVSAATEQPVVQPTAAGDAADGASQPDPAEATTAPATGTVTRGRAKPKSG